MNDNICWHVPYDKCREKHDGADLILYGRCRSGKRWFWAAGYHSEDECHGWADTEEQALSRVRSYIEGMANGNSVIAFRNEGKASHVLRDINEAKRKSRPAPNASDSRAVEFIYSYHGTKFRITKKTAKRIFYVKVEDTHYRGEGECGIHEVNDLELGYIDRRKVFEKRHDGDDYDIAVTIGSRKWRYCRCFFLEPPPPRKRTHESTPDLRKLKAEMAAAHPDKGGTCDAFREARERYVAARSMVCPA
jgi:hypothetical protein